MHCPCRLNDEEDYGRGVSQTMGLIANQMLIEMVGRAKQHIRNKSTQRKNTKKDDTTSKNGKGKG